MNRKVLLTITAIASLLVQGVLIADLAADSGTILSIRRASTEIKSMAQEPPPAALKPLEIVYYDESGELLLALVTALDEIAVIAGEAPMRDYSTMIQDAHDRFDLDFLRLEEKMRGENVKMTTVSNIMKKRRERVQEAVDDIVK